MAPLLQDGLASGIALVALLLVVRRIVAFVRPKANGGCASCGSCGTKAQRTTTEVHAVRLHRRQGVRS
jgi:hypothetical protein